MMSRNTIKTIQKALAVVIPTLIPVVGFCATPIMPGSAEDFELSNLKMYYEAQDITQDITYDDYDGLKMSLAGDDPEKGVLHLYVRADTPDEHDLAAQLNDIEPSVGVEFSLDF